MKKTSKHPIIIFAGLITLSQQGHSSEQCLRALQETKNVSSPTSLSAWATNPGEAPSGLSPLTKMSPTATNGEVGGQPQGGSGSNGSPGKGIYDKVGSQWNQFYEWTREARKGAKQAGDDTMRAAKEFRTQAAKKAFALKAKIGLLPLKTVEEYITSFLLSMSKVSPDKLIEGGITADEIADLAELSTLPQEQKILEHLKLLVDQNKLRPTLEMALEKALVKSDKIPALAPLKSVSPEKKEFILSSINNGITAILMMRGMHKDYSGIRYQEWTALSKKMIERLNQAPAGLDNLLHFAETKWGEVNEIELLADGPAAFKKRDKLLALATESIEIMSWSIYDDVTGAKLVSDLVAIKSKNPSMKIRIMVDGQVAQNPGHGGRVKELEDAGIEVIRWFEPNAPYMGQHRKMMIVDGKHVIAGGMNFGDVYSHLNPDPSVARWRDTDVYFNGDATMDARALFASIWNSQIDKGLARHEKIEINAPESHDKATQSSGSRRIAIIDHQPSTELTEGSTIMMTILKGIREAQQTINIENAYVVMFPALRAELMAAQKRGVSVSLLTNSPESVDEPIVSVPILRTALQFVKDGLNVFLRKGSTLHSKFMVIDGRYTMVMSYNLHPRSERVEGEMALLFDDVVFAQTAVNQFNQDTSGSLAFNLTDNSQQFQLPQDLSVIAVLRLFFDLL